MKKRTLLRKVLYPVIIILLTLLFLLLIPFFYMINSRYDTSRIDLQLLELARQSLPGKDVPVASVILYQGKIIGEGFNTVLTDTNPAGHAEINALQDCIRKIGFDRFSRLDRRELLLVTTYEPCPMCKGAIEEYQIRNVVFGLQKKVADKILYLKRDFGYYKNLRQNRNARMQYDLFKMNPSFDSVSYPF